MAKRRRKPTDEKGPVWVKAFLAAFRESGNTRIACDAAGIDRSTPYNHREKDEAFAKAWDDAKEEAADLLEAEAKRRAYEGVRRLKFHQGEAVMVPLIQDGKPVKDARGRQVMVPYVEHEYSDTLLIFLLKGMRPSKFRENHKIEHTGKDGGPIRYADATDDDLDAEIAKLSAI